MLSPMCFLFVFVCFFTERGTDPTSNQPVWLQMLLVAVSLTVAAVPVRNLNFKTDSLPDVLFHSYHSFVASFYVVFNLALSC